MKNYIIFCLTLVFFSCEKEEVQQLQNNAPDYSGITLSTAFLVSDSSSYQINILNNSGEERNFYDWKLAKSDDTVSVSSNTNTSSPGALLLTSNAGFSGGIKDDTIKLFDPNWILVDTWNKNE